MKRAVYNLVCLLLLAACSSPVVDAKRMEVVDGNNLQITSGTFSGGRFVAVDNVDKRWEGGLKGGKDKWGARRDLLEDKSVKEIRSVCGTWYYSQTLGPLYHMMDKDETMGGAAPMLGVAASMAAYMVAYSSTDDANIPTGIYTEFRCQSDEK